MQVRGRRPFLSSSFQLSGRSSGKNASERLRSTMDDRVKEQMSECVAGCSTFWNPVRRIRYVYHDNNDDDDGDDDHETRLDGATIGWKNKETEKRGRRDAAEDSRFRNAVSSCLYTASEILPDPSLMLYY